MRCTVKKARVATFWSQSIGQALGNRYGRICPALQPSGRAHAGGHRCFGGGLRSGQPQCFVHRPVARFSRGRPDRRCTRGGMSSLTGAENGFRLPAAPAQGSPGVRPGWSRPAVPGNPYGSRGRRSFSASPSGQPGSWLTIHGVHGTVRYRQAAGRFPDGTAGPPECQLSFRVPHQSADGDGRGFPPWPGLRGAVRHHRLRSRFRRGSGCRLASLGRRQPGGNRPRQRPHHHVQPPRVDCSHARETRCRLARPSHGWAPPGGPPGATCTSKRSWTAATSAPGAGA